METSNHITTLEFKILCPPSFEFSILNLKLNYNLFQLGSSIGGGGGERYL